MHPLELILFIAAAMAHCGISVMDSAEAEVMERASAKMASWYRMLEARIWDKEQVQGGLMKNLQVG